jgi:hypothetical protein
MSSLSLVPLSSSIHTPIVILRNFVMMWGEVRNSRENCSPLLYVLDFDAPLYRDKLK